MKQWLFRNREYCYMTLLMDDQRSISSFWTLEKNAVKADRTTIKTKGHISSDPARLWKYETDENQPQQCRPLLTKKCVIVLGFRYSAQTNYEMTIYEFLYSFLFFRAISIRKMQFLSTDTVGIRFHFMKNGSFSFFLQIDEIMKRSHRMYQLKCSWLQISGIEHQLF